MDDLHREDDFMVMDWLQEHSKYIVTYDLAGDDGDTEHTLWVSSNGDVMHCEPPDKIRIQQKLIAKFLEDSTPLIIFINIAAGSFLAKNVEIIDPIEGGKQC